MGILNPMTTSFLNSETFSPHHAHFFQDLKIDNNSSEFAHPKNELLLLFTKNEQLSQHQDKGARVQQQRLLVWGELDLFSHMCEL